MFSFSQRYSQISHRLKNDWNIKKCEKAQKQAYHCLQIAKSQKYFQAYIYEWQILKIHRVQEDRQPIFKDACDLKLTQAYLCYAQFHKYRECYDQALKWFLLYYAEIKESEKYPKNGELEYQIGNCFLITNQKTEAIEFYTRGKIYGNLKYVVQLSKLLIEEKNQKEAQEMLQEGISFYGKSQYEQQFNSLLALAHQKNEYHLTSKYFKLSAQPENTNGACRCTFSSEKIQMGPAAQKMINNIELDNNCEVHGQKTSKIL